MMAGWDGNGSFTFTYDWTDQRDAGVRIRADQMDQQFADAASGLNNCRTLDGQNAATDNLPMGGYKHTGVADGTARNHYAAIGQIQDGELTYVAAGGSADTYTATLSPAITSYTTNLTVSLLIDTGDTNTGASTLNLNSVGAANIKRVGGSDPVAGDIVAGQIHDFKYDGTNFVLQNPAKAGAVSAFGATLIDDADAAAGRATLAAQEDVITTQGDLVRGDSSGDAERLALGADNYYLASDGSDAVWQALDAADLTGTIAAARIDAASELTVGSATGTTDTGDVNAEDLKVNGSTIVPRYETAQASTSGTAISFAISESGRQCIKIMLDQVSLSGDDNFLVQLSTSSTYKTSGYVSDSTSGGSGNQGSMSGFVVAGNDAASKVTGIVTLEHVGGNKWVESHSVTVGDNHYGGGGVVTMGGAVDGVRVTRTGTNTFDSGAIGCSHYGGSSA